MKTSWIFWPATAEKPQGLWLRLAELETKYGNAESLDNVGTPGVALKKRGNDGWWARAPGLQWWDFYGIHISIIYVYNTYIYICIYIYDICILLYGHHLDEFDDDLTSWRQWTGGIITLNGYKSWPDIMGDVNSRSGWWFQTCFIFHFI